MSSTHDGGLTVLPVPPVHRQDWLRMRRALYPDTPIPTHDEETDAILNQPNNQQCFIALKDAKPIGFIEVSIRDWAEGCTTKNVGYLESMYVDEFFRRLGVGEALCLMAETWARQKGATEMGSDADIDNEAAISWHHDMNYRESGRSIHLNKKL
jgi:aminoglycoside 6'-N-acetyltransferase I